MFTNQNSCAPSLFGKLSKLFFQISKHAFESESVAANLDKPDTQKDKNC